MARPRKNRIGEHAAALIDEIAYHLAKDLVQALAVSQETYRREVTALRAEVRKLERKLDTMTRSRRPAKRLKLGRWVPGGPGRPPKDATERIAAFSARASPRPPGKKPSRPRSDR